MPMTATGLSVSTAAATALATKCHMFKIEGYKRVKILYGNGKSLDSGSFEAAGRTWRIQFFPDGNKKETAGYISLFLTLEDAEAGKDDEVLAEVRLSLVRHHRANTTRTPPCVSFTTTFNKDKKTVGQARFIRREDLEKSEFLKDDCLAVRCDVAVLKQPVDAEAQAALARDMERLDMVCDCKDGSCKGRHLTAGAWLRETVAKFIFGCFQV